MKHIIWLLVGLPYLCVGQLYTIYEDGKWGAINKEGKIVLEPQYTKLIPTPIKGTWIVEKAEKQGIWLEEWGEITMIEYDTIAYREKSEFAFFETKRKEKVGILDSVGLEVIENRYDRISYMAISKQPWWKVRKDGKEGAIDNEGTEFLPIVYDDVWEAAEGILNMTKEGLSGCKSLNGKLFFEPQFMKIEGGEYGVVVVSHEDNTYSAWNAEGEQELDHFPWPPKRLEYGYWLFDRNENRKGLAYKGGKVISRNRFYDAEVLGEGFVAVQRLEDVSNWNVVNDEGRFLLPRDYQDIQLQQGKWIWVKVNNRWGVYNQYGRLIAEPVLDRIAEFEGGVAVISIDGRMGLLNQYGDYLAEASYDDIDLLEGIALLRRDSTISQVAFNLAGAPTFNKQLVVRKAWEQKTTREGEVSLDPRDYGWVKVKRGNFKGDWYYGPAGIPSSFGSSLCDTVFIVQNAPFAILGNIKGSTGKMSHDIFYYDLSKPVVGFQEIMTNDFKNGDVARAHSYRYARTLDEGVLLIGRDGEIKGLNGVYSIEPFQYGYARVSGFGGLSGLINEEGKLIIPHRYEALSNFEKGSAIFKWKKQWGLMDSTLNMTYLDGKYENVEHIGEGQHLKVGVRKAACVLKDRNNQDIAHFEADEARMFREGLAVVRVKAKWGFIDTTGKYIGKPTYLNAYDFHEGLAAVKSERRWGYMNAKGELQIGLQFDSVSNFIHGAAWAEYKGRYGLIKPDGKWRVKPKYENAEYLTKNFFLLERKEKVGVMNHKGQWIVPPIYDYIQVKGKYFKVRDGNQQGYIDQRGKTIIPVVYDELSDIKDNQAFYSNMPRPSREWEQEGGIILHEQSDGQVELEFVPRDSVGTWRDESPDVQAISLFDLMDESEIERQERILTHDYTEPNARIRMKMGNGMTIGQQACLYGLIDFKGKEVLPPIYEEIRYQNGLYQLIKNKRISYANEKGEIIYPSNLPSTEPSN